MLNNGERPFLDADEVTNEALRNIGKDVKLEEKEETSIDDKISTLTVQELLQELKTDEFEKLYITTSAVANTPNMEEIPDEQIDQVQTVAEYRLSQMPKDQIVDEELSEKLKSAANFYMIPRNASYKFSVGNNQHSQDMKIYTVNDVEGRCLYTVVDENNITISTNARDAIEEYLEKSYPNEIADGTLKVSEVIESFTPHDLDELYEMVGDDHPFTMRFLPSRVDEIAKSKGITQKTVGTRVVDLDEYDDLSEQKQVELNEEPKDEPKLEEDEGEVLEEPEGKAGEVREGRSARAIEEEENKEKQVTESYIEKIARLNHVKPAVVNTRVIENFEKVEEDVGIPLKGRYKRGDVVAVRIPYKLGYRTFLVEKSTGMTIDGKGALDRRGGKFYDYDEIEDYFRFKLRDGNDGGDDGKPLRYDEGRSNITYIGKSGKVEEEKYINNGKAQDMLRSERERYLAEVEEVDKRLEEAIEIYQKNSTHENYEKVRELVQDKVKIDDKYNALEKQREVTEKTIENTENVIGRKLDDDEEEDKVPWDDPRGRW